MEVEAKIVVFDEYDKYGFIDKTGKVVISLKYNYVGKFDEGVALVELNGKFGIMKNPLAKAPKQEPAKQDSSQSVQQTQVTQANNKEIVAKYSLVKLLIDGVEAKGVEIYNIGNNNYFKLRDLYELIGVEVQWDQSKRSILLKTK